MGEPVIFECAREAFQLAALLSAPVLLACLGVGVVVSLLQAVTQVQDQSISFVPKLLAVALLLSSLGPAAFREITSFAGRMLMLAGRI